MSSLSFCSPRSASYLLASEEGWNKPNNRVAAEDMKNQPGKGQGDPPCLLQPGPAPSGQQSSQKTWHFLGHRDLGGNQVTHSPQLPHHAVPSRLGGSTGKGDKKEMTGVGCFGGWPQEHECVGPEALPSCS